MTLINKYFNEIQSQKHYLSIYSYIKAIIMIDCLINKSKYIKKRIKNFNCCLYEIISSLVFFLSKEYINFHYNLGRNSRQLKLLFNLN